MNTELQNIVSQVKKMFSQYGIKSITMDDISRELGISKKTLYQYINNKDELVQQVIEYEDKETKDYFIELGVEKMNAIEILMHINRYVTQKMKSYNHSFQFDLKKYHPEIYHSTKKRHSKEMFDNILQNLQQGKKEGFFRENLNEVLITKLYLSRIEASHDSDIFTKDEMFSNDFISQIMEYHIRGVVNEKGLHEFLRLKELMPTTDMHEDFQL